MKRVVSIDLMTAQGISTVMARNLRRVPEKIGPFVGSCPSSPGQVVVTHNLGVKPDMIDVQPMVSGRWWADEADMKSWTDKVVVFHATAAGQYRVFVESI